MKKGFTLIELMIVIALMAAIMLLVVPNLIKQREQIVDMTFESKIKLIESAALEWGMNNINRIELNGECYYIAVNKLVSDGYLAGDNEDKSVVLNPETGESLNSKLVCVKYDLSRGVQYRTLLTEYQN